MIVKLQGGKKDFKKILKSIQKKKKKTHYKGAKRMFSDF